LTVPCLFLPAPGAVLANPLAPVNIDCVYGFSDTAAQTWMPEWAWLAFLIIALPVVVFIPTHLVLRKWAAQAAPACARPRARQG